MKKSTSKKSSGVGRSPDRWLDWEDAVNDHCINIATLAELLESSRDDLLTAELVNNTGSLIQREVKQLKAVVKSRPGREVAR
jgi:hypothetical protein